MTTNRYASAIVLVSVKCEGCQCPYRFEQVVKAEDDRRATSWFGGPARDWENYCLEICGKRLAASIEQKSVRYLGFKKCPECSHIQSWMIPAYRDHLQDNLGALILAGGVLAGFAVFAVIEGVAEVVGLAVAVLALIAWLALPDRRRLALIRRLEQLNLTDASSNRPIEVQVIRMPKIVIERVPDW